MANDARYRPFPAHSLEKALQVIKAIVDSGASRPMDRLLLAQAIGRTPSSSEFRMLLSSSLKYGLTEGTEKADQIKPTPLGLQVGKPTSESEKRQALVRAVMTPVLFKEIFNHFNKQKLPRGDFLKNVLERQFNVDAGFSDELAGLVLENARFVGVAQNISGSEYLNLDLSAVEPAAADDDGVHKEMDPSLSNTLAAARANSGEAQLGDEPPKRIFVAHGKKHGPLKEIQAILTKFKIPHVVAAEEPHAGRPISLKVAQTMRECSAGLFVFTKDEEFRDSDGNAVWRPSENVVFELGAGNVLWGSKLIILKEEGVNFASDYKDLGYITFESGKMDSIGMKLFMELIAFDFIKVQPV